MQVKTAELDGAALDWAVAKCEGHSVVETYGAYTRIHLPDPRQSGYTLAFSPSSDWSHGGAIIEREGITVLHCHGDLGEPRQYWAATSGAQSWVWGYGPYHEQDDFKSAQVRKNETQLGPTPLIAAMRCFAVSRLGETVDVPDELMSDGRSFPSERG